MSPTHHVSLSREPQGRFSDGLRTKKGHMYIILWKSKYIHLTVTGNKALDTSDVNFSLQRGFSNVVMR